MNADANHAPTSPVAAADRVPLARLAASGPGSPALLRVVGQVVERGPGRVAVAAFQSSV